MGYDDMLAYAQRAASHLTECWPVKVAVGGIIALVQFHLELITLFTVLIVIDLFTKWLSLSYGYLKTEDKEPTVIDSIRAMPAAHRAGVISSKQMKYQFVSKMAVYIMLTIASGVADEMLFAVHRDPMLMELCISYLAASEVLSVVENLNDTGVSILSGLIQIIKSRRNR